MIAIPDGAEPGDSWGHEDEDGVWTARLEASGAVALSMATPTQAYIDRMEEAAAPPPPPDPNGYLLAAMGVFVGDGDPMGLIRGNEVLGRWPSFSTALLQRNWVVARATLAAAYSVGTITEGEHAALVALLGDYHIPES